MKFLKAENKPQINSAKYWDNHGVGVPKYDEFVMQSKIPRWVGAIVATENIEKPVIADLGGSDGSLLKAITMFCKDADATVIDYSERALKAGVNAYPEIKFILENIVDYAKVMDPVDFIICNHTLEHFEDPEPFVAMCLKKCKYMVIGVPYKTAYNCPEHMVYFDEHSFDGYNRVQFAVLRGGQSMELVIKGAIQ